MKINELVDLLELADNCGQPPCIEGIHGIGKSEVVQKYAENHNLHNETVILSMMDVGDMLGIPNITDIEGISTTTWSPPAWYINIVNNAWPKYLEIDELVFNDKKFEQFIYNKIIDIPVSVIPRGELNKLYSEFYNVINNKIHLLRQDKVSYNKSKRSVLFLDEFNRAPTDILNASLELILNHRMGHHELPLVNGKETFVVAAINPSEGSYTVQDFDPAMLDRFLMCKLEPNLSEWVKWARSNGINNIIIEFLLDKNKKFFHMVNEDASKGTSPRSWVKLSKYLNYIKTNSLKLNTNYVLGLLGVSATAQFINYYNNNKNLTFEKLENIILTEIKTNPKNNDPELIAEKIKDIIKDIDVTKRIDYADGFHKIYINKSDEKEMLPLLVFLYALPLETFSTVILNNYSKNNIKNRIKISDADWELTGKKKIFERSLKNIELSIDNNK